MTASVTVRIPAQAWCREAVDTMNRTTRLLVSVTS